MSNLYLTLLRGINVGGNNIIKMVALKACFEAMGFTNVKTYIQSGNVVFTAKEKNAEKLTEDIEKELSREFNYKSRVVVLSAGELKKSVQEAPKGFGQNPEQYRYDVLFIKSPLKAKEAMKEITTKEGVDEVWGGQHALYFARLISKATQSYLPKIIKLPLYKNLTIRNWNTATKLLSLMESV